MNTTFRRSKGQGRLKFNSCHTLSTAGASNIVRMPMSRSVTGRQLPIRIHQHFGQRLHLVWHTPTKTNYCMGRVFLMVADMLAFCHQLTRVGAQGLCSCVSEDILQGFEDKYNQCLTLPPSDSELGIVGALRTWRKCVQGSLHTPNCKCIVTSSYCIEWY
jgi:hypothetical protein